MVYAESGMKGISEISGDIRELLSKESDDPRAAEAVQSFCYSVRKWIGALAAALEGIDVLVFTGGIGEHSQIIRQRICDDLDWLGVTLDMGANVHGEQCISAPTSKVLVFALATDEELVMAEIASVMLNEVKHLN
jgi:acetate kinase